MADFRLSKKTQEAVYRKVHMDNLTQDAIAQVKEYLNINDIELDRELLTAEYRYLANEFDLNHDCNIADNDQWQSLIAKYVKELSNN